MSKKGTKAKKSTKKIIEEEKEEVVFIHIPLLIMLG